MHIVVCVKQVPDTTEVKVNQETGTLIREGVPSIINPFDQFALEMGLKVRDQAGESSLLTVVSMGPPMAKEVITLSLAIGADKGVLLTDRAFAGADTLATSYTLAQAIKQLGKKGMKADAEADGEREGEGGKKKPPKVDLVLCGLQAIDGDTAQVGPGLAMQLRVPQICYCEDLELPEAGKKKLKARRLIDDGYEVVEAKLPVLCTMTTPSDFVPTNPPFSRIMKAKRKPYEEWTAADLEGHDPEKLGLDGSPTWVEKVYPPPQREKGVMIEGTTEEIVTQLLEILKKEHFL